MLKMSTPSLDENSSWDEVRILRYFLYDFLARERFVSEPAFLAMTVESERIRLFKEYISALLQVR